MTSKWAQRLVWGTALLSLAAPWLADAKEDEAISGLEALSIREGLLGFRLILFGSIASRAFGLTFAKERTETDEVEQRAADLRSTLKPFLLSLSVGTVVPMAQWEEKQIGWWIGLTAASLGICLALAPALQATWKWLNHGRRGVSRVLVEALGFLVTAIWLTLPALILVSHKERWSYSLAAGAVGYFSVAVAMLGPAIIIASTMLPKSRPPS